MGKFKVRDHDVFYLSYDEPNAEKNYADICNKIPWVKRVHGVKGSDAAHKACAEAAETERFTTVDGDNIINPKWLDVEIEFDLNTYNPKKEVHDTSVLETYATGKKVKPRGTGKVSDPYEGYSPDLKADDYAKGGLASYDNYLPDIEDIE